VLRRLLVIASVVPSSPILVTLMISSSETSVLTRVTRRNIQEDGILDIHVVFIKELPDEVQCIVPVQQPVVWSPKFREKSSQIFKLSP
jgi:hypothetical protein